MDYFKMLATEPMFWSRIGMAVNDNERDENGRLTFGKNDWSNYLYEHEKFLKAGCRVHTTCLHNGWIGIDIYDYTAVEQTLDAICGISPDVLYLPRINLNPPKEWYIANPLEASVTQNGPQSAAEIQRIFEDITDQKEWESMRTGGGGKRGVHFYSFSSKKWMEDATKMLQGIIAYIENGKYGKQVVGYQIAFGMCGETCQWGTWSNPSLWGDFSMVNAKAFYEYCLDIYGSKKNMEEAFGYSPVTYENVIPSPEERLVFKNDLKSFFRVGRTREILYAQFVSWKTANNICYFGKVLKEIVPNKPVGAFYGYLLTNYPNETGHACVQVLLDSPYIDFLSAPKIYYRCGAGESGGSQATSMSVSRKKIWLDELDNDTYIAKSYQQKENHPNNFDETRTILWREVARNLSWNNQNFWWMDLYGGWYLDEKIMEEIKKLVEFNSKIRCKEYRSISEILFVLDENALAYQNCDVTSMGCRKPGLVNEMGAELHLCGAPVDECRVSDLKEMDLSSYKMIVFANAFMVNNEIRKVIKAIPSTTLCIWNYAAGIRNPDFDLANVKELTGIAKTGKRGNSLLVAFPNLRANDFHELAKQQGCHMFTSAGCSVFADNRFVGIFPGKHAIRTLRFPQKGIYKDIISGRIFEKDNEIILAPKSAMVFVM